VDIGTGSKFVKTDSTADGSFCLFIVDITNPSLSKKLNQIINTYKVNYG